MISADNVDVHVFVYGTLLRGESNHALLVSSMYLGEASTVQGFDLYALGSYPGMIRGHGIVVGERYGVSARTLAALDALEEHPDYYERQTILLDSGHQVLSYLLPAREVAGCPHIASGSWRRYRSRQGMS